MMAAAVRQVTDMVSTPTYVRHDDPGVEPPVDNEELKTNELADVIGEVAKKHFSSHRHGSRVTHVKTQGIAKGTITIPNDLPEHLAQGLFSKENAGEHPVGFRFANEPIFLQDDRAPGPRGLGMKIFNVKGEFLDAIGEGTHTHDMTFNNAPIIELRDVTTCLEIFRIRERNYADHDQLEKEIKKRSDKDLQMAPQQLPNQHFLSYTMHSQAAYRFGNNVCKFALVPSTSQQQHLEKTCKITDNSEPEQHSKWLQEYFEQNDAEFDLKVQLARDLRKQPVEDASVEWEESQVPFETVAHIVIPKGQDVFDPQRRIFWDDGMKLNPWYGLAAHRPLGSINRLRKTIYQRSLAIRTEYNARKPKAVSSIDEIP